jgi:hypothetical protein
MLQADVYRVIEWTGGSRIRILISVPTDRTREVEEMAWPRLGTYETHVQVSASCVSLHLPRVSEDWHSHWSPLGLSNKTATLRATSYLLATSIRTNGPCGVVIPAANKRLGKSCNRPREVEPPRSKTSPCAGSQSIIISM